MEERIQYLFERYEQGRLTLKERLELGRLVNDPSAEAYLRAFIDRQLALSGQADADGTPQLSATQFDHLFAGIERQIADPVAAEEPVHRVRLLRRWWWAAASIILLLGAGAYFWIDQTNKGTQVTTVQSGQNDALPGKNGAILTLANGRKVVLDSLGNGTIATQNGAQVNLKNGQLTYNPTGETSGVMVYNTMTTPKGRQFKVTMPDGTMVWLNAASSITYPTVFTEKERRVKVTGEVYFEVAKNAQKPFTVDVNNAATVQVLGTHFNVNAYADEAAIRTTLLEGKVKVIKGTAIETLHPGQQAAISDQIRVIPRVNTDLVMAWKNGVFNFNGLSLEELMRQLSRWYDVEVVYTSGIPDVELYGKIGRDLNLSQILQSLQEMDVQCRLEGRKLIVD